jgi:branched-chain amino acid transport system ATP-binding protein
MSGVGASAALHARDLRKAFGGVAAVDGVNLEVYAGELHALIGPNGAGKSTLVNLLAGALRADAGSVLLDGQDITALPMHRRVALGLARSYQVTSVFGDLPALENVALALQARQAGLFDLWRQRSDAALRDEAQTLLARVQLAPSARAARELAHGEQRKLEVALALGTGARVLLLDEPLAGMGESESRAMIEVIAQLKNSVTVLLIEHDMDAVFRLADRVSVLAAGKVIATGAPQAIAADAQVRSAYLGEADAAAA